MKHEKIYKYLEDNGWDLVFSDCNGRNYFRGDDLGIKVNKITKDKKEFK